MEITASWVALNFAYLLYVAAAVPKKIIPLRLVLLAASVAFIVYGVIAGINSIIIWNVLFGGAQIVQLVRLFLAERNLSFTEEELEAHAAIFPDLRGRDFLYVWSLGEERLIPKSTKIMTQGVKNTDLVLLLDGIAEAFVDGRSVAQRPPLTLLGEMSFLTGAAASADVVVSADTRVRCWPQDKVRALETLKPEIYSALVASMGRQVSEKLATR